MARGWESKSVEEQQAETSEFHGKPKPRLTAEQMANQQLREGLLMSRNRIIQQLTTVENSRHLKMLESALADLDVKISQLG